MKKSLGKGLRVPVMGLHKASGQMRVVIDGRTFYLGKAGAEADQKYRSLIACWMETDSVPESGKAVEGVTLVADVVAAFLEGHERHYVRADGSQTGELNNYREAIRVLLELFCTLPVEEMGPKRLKEVQRAMIGRDWCRRVINAQVRRLKRIFKWAVSEELVSPTVYQGLRTVEGLRRNRTAARESDGVLPVPDDWVKKALPKMPAAVAAMVQLQLLSGMRVSEALLMRGCDVDRSGDAWIHRSSQHKTMHLSRERWIALGPRCQELLGPWLLKAGDGPVFSPRRCERVRSKERRRKRKSKGSPNQAARGEAAKKRKRALPPGDYYTVAAYRRAIHRACDAAEVERWSPNRLRHNAAERFRKEFGVEVQRCPLGHSDIRTTQLYSEMDQAKAIDAAKKIG